MDHGLGAGHLTELGLELLGAGVGELHDTTADDAERQEERLRVPRPPH